MTGSSLAWEELGQLLLERSSIVIGLYGMTLPVLIVSPIWYALHSADIRHTLAKYMSIFLPILDQSLKAARTASLVKEMSPCGTFGTLSNDQQLFWSDTLVCKYLGTQVPICHPGMCTQVSGSSSVTYSSVVVPPQ